VRFLRISLPLSAFFCFAIAGCKPEDDIAKETVTLPDREKIRLRVAIIERPKNIWFFRLSGPADLVKEHGPAFEDLVKSVRFDAGKEPSWTDPKGWKKDPVQEDRRGEMGMERMAGFRIGAKPKEMEITVVKLQAKGFDLIKNMHRWQKQVNQPLTETHEDLKKQVPSEKFATHEVKWVDLTGLGTHAVSKPAEPMALNQKKFVLPLGPGGGGSKIPFTYKLPEGWVKKPSRQIALEVLEVSDDDNSAEITFVPLPKDGGGVAGNINRWRKEVELEGLPQAAAEQSAVERKVAGVKSFYVDIDNPKGPAERNRTLGVIIPLGHTTWFVKMSGPRAWVGQNKAAYETFIDSIKLEGK